MDFDHKNSDIPGMAFLYTNLYLNKNKEETVYFERWQ